MDLLTIGAFARLAHLSPKALRLYDELQLLPPAQVDPDTGYRWYSPDQLEQARLVALLRQLDMPLAGIAEILALTPDAAATSLTAYQAEQERATATKRELVDFLVNQLTGKKSTMYPIHTRDVPARTLLSISEHLTTDQIGAFAGPLFGLFGGPTVARPTGISGLPFLRFHGEVDNDSDGPVEFCCPVEPTALTELTSRFPEMATSSEPAGREAYLQVTKAAMNTSIGYESLRHWFTDHNEEAVGAVRQIFLTNPNTANPDDLVYELAVPLA
jgi:DNA-binding transcriptional MerR regulator